MSDTVRETKTGDELKPGDWLAPEQVMERASEVLFAYVYPAAADGSRDNSGTHVQLVVREQGTSVPWPEIVAGSHLFSLATEADLAALREQAERAQKVADIRALADWLEANPSVPMPASLRTQASPGCEVLPEVDVWNSGAQGIAELERVAAIMGSEIVHYDERSDATKTFGRVEYSFIAWHKDGRPAEPEADPTGLAYSRADDADDPTPVSGHRVEPHVGGVTDGGLVDETPPTSDLTGAAMTESCVFVGDNGGWCNTHEAIHIATGEAECGCPVYPFAGRGDGADTIVDHRFGCPDAS